MNPTDHIYEYELIDISFDIDYELPEEESTSFVREDVPGVDDQKDEQPQIGYDADGIPMGATIEEIRQREMIITNFLGKWRESNTEGKILNESLGEYIYFRNISFTEAKEHSAKSYKSTRAVMLLEEVLKNALPVRRVAVKTSDSNQSSFAYMLVMVYRHEGLGTIKLTVGVRLSGQRIQYGITAIRPGEPLIKDSSKSKKKKKRNPHK